MTTSEPQTHRVVLFGNSQVGKTSLIHRFIRKTFEKQQKNTVGAVFHTYEEEVNGNTVIMQIWDTAGHEKYRSLGPIYYRNASAGIAVFDISDADSLDGLSQWIDDFHRHTEDPLLYIVGNKIDLKSDNDQELLERASEFADKNGAKIMYTSAKEDTNVTQLFKTVFDDLVQSGKVMNIEKSRLQASQKTDEKKDSSCC